MLSVKKIMLSVVVPVYNVEKYLPDCIKSIQRQSFSEYECILVDDGSTDSSGRLCDEIVRKDPRFHVIHKTNGGLSDARNVGLSAVSGKYVSFIDGDDWIDIDMFQSMLERAEINKLDVICCNVQTFDDKTHEISSRRELCAFCKDDEVVNWKNTQILFRAINNISVCNKIFLTRLLHESKTIFPVGVRFEDIIFWSNLFFKIERIGCISQYYYHYRIFRTGSIVQKNDYRPVVQSYQNMFFTLEKNNVLEFVKDELISALTFKLVYCLVRSQKKYRIDFFYGMQHLLQKCGVYSFRSSNGFLIRFIVLIYSLFARMPYSFFCVCCFPVFALSRFSLLVSFRNKLKL